MEKDEERIQNILSKLKKAKEIIGELNKIAEADGEISLEEMQLLNSINFNLEKFFSLVSSAANDGVITDEELVQIHVFEKRIIQEASSKAFEDGRISNEERALLTKLILLMEEMENL